MEPGSPRASCCPAPAATPTPTPMPAAAGPGTSRACAGTWMTRIVASAAARVLVLYIYVSLGNEAQPSDPAGTRRTADGGVFKRRTLECPNPRTGPAAHEPAFPGAAPRHAPAGTGGIVATHHVSGRTARLQCGDTSAMGARAVPVMAPSPGPPTMPGSIRSRSMKPSSPRSLFAAALVTMLSLPHAASAHDAGEARAKNVIVFLADAAGVSTLHGASLHGYGEPLKLHIQGWPHLGLSDTSPVDKWVSDSANGMSSIMTGVKTRNGVISQGPDAVRREKDGTPTRTLLEYAEERGLRTGVVSTQSVADATPAATYAHSNDRGKWGEIFPQAFSPRYGDGVDVLSGSGREKIGSQLAAAGTSFEALSTQHGRRIHASLADVDAGNARPVVVADGIDPRAATLKALDILQDAPEGYLLV